MTTTTVAVGMPPGPAPLTLAMQADPAIDQARDERFRMYVIPELAVLLRVATRLTGNVHDAEDVVQETLLRAYRAIDRFDGRHPRAWLLTILRNTNINRVRKRTPSLFIDEDRALGALAADGADGRDGPEETVLDAIPEAALIEAIHDLPAKFRDVLVLVDVDDLSYQEAADVLAVPIGTVMSRLHRARKRVRGRLEAVGISVEGRS